MLLCSYVSIAHIFDTETFHPILPRLSFSADPIYMRDWPSSATPANYHTPQSTCLPLSLYLGLSPCPFSSPIDNCTRGCAGDAGSFNRCWFPSSGIPPRQESWKKKKTSDATIILSATGLEPCFPPQYGAKRIRGHTAPPHRPLFILHTLPLG